MDFEFVRMYTPMYMEAAKLTFGIAWIGILLSIVIGFVCCLICYYNVPILKRIVGVYIELSRNTPLLIQLFFLYFGLPKLGIVLNSSVCGIIGLTFLGSSYMSEAFRSGLEVLWYVTLPQAIAVALPAFSANIIFLIKETSVFSVIALADLMYVAKGLIGLYYKTDEALLMLVIAYLILLLPISLILAFIERKVRYAGVRD